MDRRDYNVMRKKGFLCALAGATTVLLTACGGVGGGGSNNASTSDPLAWEPGVFNDPATYKSYCENPRSGASAVTGEVFDDRVGSTLEENHWLRAWINDSYLWYDEVPDLNPDNYATLDYFALLKTDATTASGKEKDEYHFTYNTADWEARSQTGVSVGYGIDFVLQSSAVPREIVVALIEPGSDADIAGAVRGDRVLTIDGYDVDTDSQAGIDALNQGLYPDSDGEQHLFELQQTDGTVKTLALVAGPVAKTSVRDLQIIDTTTGPVGYMLFTTHNSPAERLLVQAYEQLAAENVTDLILDLRYNGGGYLAIASQVAYMTAGAGQTSNQVFEHLEFNDKYPNSNPVTGGANDPIPFFDETLGFSLSEGQSLPSLNLPRVFVLTTSNTCSASESIINGLRGVGVEVIQIGGATCGKPYGFYSTDNCGTTYFSVQFQSVNALGFGDYADGFASEQEDAPGAVSLPGCIMADDYDHALGDLDEAMLATALGYRQDGSCPLNIYATGQLAKPEQRTSVKAPMVRGPWESNRIMELPRQ
ncbi:S41 family peptidase [Halioxenophilus aromaticivorans]|uniref:S41 family peptidase n=1 Tax=Halioxenophilus aromaticivorans TaxID=1306992 RepID=A0AAV3U178_9ALTE